MSANSLTFRQKYLTGPLLRRVRRTLPRMSDTEREALAAGTVWWETQLFSGNPDWSHLLDMGPPKLTDEEKAFLDGPVDMLCSTLDDWEITFRTRTLPEKVWDFIKSEGFLGMIVPKEYGGLGFSASAHSEVVMKIASRSITAAVTVMVPNSLGPGELLLEYGTDEQKEHYLPRLASGQEIPCFALTSLEAGSDAASMTDTGIVCRGTYEGKEVLGIRLNWSKRYITLAPVATLLGLAFKLRDPDGLLGDREDIGITVALVPTHLPGVSIGRRHLPSMQGFQNGPNSGKDVFIPLDNVIGGVERVGQGWKMLVSALAAGRGISLPSLSVSGAKVAARTTGAYARVRRQFGIPVGRFEGVQEALGEIAAQCYAMEAARRTTTLALDQGEKPAVVTAIVKAQATERMRRVINLAMDVHGGKAICDGPRNYLGNIYRAIPVAITVEGANILTRSLMIYGQGAIRCHPHLIAEMTAAHDPDEAAGTGAFDREVMRHVGYQIRLFGRALLHGFTGARFARSPVSGPTAVYFRDTTRAASAFALVSEAALVLLGGSLKRREMLSGRLADILGELYFLSAVLKRFEDDGRPEADLPLVEYCCQSGLYAIHESLDQVLANFPSRMAAWLLRATTLPFGYPRERPMDSLVSACAEVIMSSSPARDRLTDGLYKGPRNDPIAALDEVLARVEDIETLKRKSGDGKTGEPVDGADAERLAEYERLLREVLSVDDFAPADIVIAASPPTGQETPRMDAASAG